MVNGVLYVVGETDGMLYALHARDGSLLWHVQTGYPSVSLPQVVNGSVYVVGSDPTAPSGSVSALRADDGSLSGAAG